MRRLLTKISVERCARTSSSSRGWMAVQIDVRDRALRRGPARDLFRLADLRHVLDRHFDAQVELLLLRRVDDRDRAIRRRRRRRSLNSSWMARPARSRRSRSCASLRCRFGRLASAALAVARRRGTARPRRAAAASPTARSAECGPAAPSRSRARSASSRSSESARCAPRLVGTSAWISSTITVSTERSASRAFDVSSR